MTDKVRRVPIFAKVLIIIASFFLIIGAAFVGLGYYVNSQVRAMPYVFVDGTEISGLTYEEAVMRLGVADIEERIENVSVTLRMPLESEIRVSGSDVSMSVNTRSLVSNALEFGRGAGFVWDTVFFIERYIGSLFGYDSPVDLETSRTIDTGNLYDKVSQFTEEFNLKLAQLIPYVSENSITFTLGAGHTSANSGDAAGLVLEGLQASFENGEPVIIDYMPPEFEDFRLLEELGELWRQTLVLPVSAAYDREARAILPDVPGLAFDFTEAVRLLRTTNIGESAVVELIEISPEITKEYLESLLFSDIFGEETTNVGGTENRRHNVMLAAQAVDGYVLYPGEEFSFNRIVGRRTAAAGFRTAPVLIYGEFVPGIGGGICQVSSTIFSAILDTNIHVTERRAHGRPIDYLPRGRDAAVAWGVIDFRFINNTELPLRIDVTLEGRTLTARVIGTIPSYWS